MKNPGRKIYHLTGGLLMIGLYVVLGRGPGLVALAGLFVVMTAVDVARLRSERINRFFFEHLRTLVRDSERTTLSGTPWYVLGVLSAAALYDLPVAVYAVAFLAVGDVSATTVGERWGTIKLPGGKKSVQGTLAFVVAAALAGFAISSFFPMSPTVYLAGALVAAVVEILPLRVNDNLSIPVIAGAVMKALSAGC